MKNNTTIFSSRFLALIFFLFSFSTISAQTVDTDGDGIVDQLDLDDDNDGIPDSAECSVTPVNMVAWTNNTDAFPPTVTTAYNSFITAANSGAGGGIVRTRNTANNFQQISQIDATSEAQAVTNNEYVSYSITTGARYIAINQIGYFAQSASVNNIAYTFTLRMSSDNFATNTQVHSPIIYSASGADITVNTLQTLYLSPNTTYQFRVYFYNVSGGAASVIGHDDFKLRGGFECDTDGDNLPNRLDLDSDGDGCFDAIEGDENVLLNQLNSNGSINITSNGGIGTTVGTNNGVPNLVNSGGAADIGADVGQGIGESQNAALLSACIDSDNDGVQNEFDLDDDNDGILDLDEDCAYLAQNNSGSWIGQTTSTATVSRNGTLTTFTNSYNDLQNRYHINQNGGGQWVDVLGNVSYQMTFSQAIPANEIAILIFDLTPNLSTSFNNFTVTINGGAPNNVLSSVAVSSITGYLNYNTATGVATLNPSGGNSQSVMLKGVGNTMVSSILITSSGLVAQDRTDYSIFGKKICDLDLDGIPNQLDLDTDGDGCFDAIEGDESVNSAQLNPNGSINTSATGGLGAATTSIGVPNLVNSGGSADIGGDVGQGIGDSQNSLINGCVCYENPGLVTGQTYPVKHGITALSRAGADSGNWPMLRNSAYTALESKTKGFVITRNSSPETTIAIPVVGMVVFDTDENAGKGCLKIYTGSAVGEGWKCYTTPGCP